MRASARNEYLPPINLTSGSQGSMRLQSDQNVLVGWGSNPWYVDLTYLLLRCDSNSNRVLNVGLLSTSQHFH